MTKKMLSVLAFAALLLGWHSLADCEESRIQPAKRSQAVQIQDDDVVLENPALQKFLQSDLFHRIIEDERFLRDAWARQAIRAALGDVDLERVRHEISETPVPGLWRAELGKVLLELDGIPWTCSPCRG